MQELIDILHHDGCSLVIRDNEGMVTTYNKKGVRDLVWLLDNYPQRLKDAQIADKVIGKAAAGLIACAQDAQQTSKTKVYADVMSRKAVPLLETAGIDFSFGEMVDHIVIPDGDNRCPLEAIVAEAHTAKQVEQMLRRHFQEMNNKNLTNTSSL